MYRYRTQALLLAAALFIVVSCRHQQAGEHVQAETVDTTTMLLVGKGTSADGSRMARVYAPDSLTDQFEHLYLCLADENGQAIAPGSVDIQPEMKMGMMSHGAPFVASENLGQGIFRSGAVFIMPSADEHGHSWQINLLWDEAGDNRNRISIPVQVSHLEKPRTLPFDAGREGRFFISLANLRDARAGEQEIQFLLHKVQGNEFPAVETGYTILLEADMPDMAHGSEKHQQAQPSGGGLYKGKVNLAMPGVWEIKASLMKDGQKVSTDPIKFQIRVS